MVGWVPHLRGSFALHRRAVLLLPQGVEGMMMLHLLRMYILQTCVFVYSIEREGEGVH